MSALILGINASGTFTIGTDKDTDQTVAENSPFVITCYAKELEKGEVYRSSLPDMMNMAML